MIRLLSFFTICCCYGPNYAGRVCFGKVPPGTLSLPPRSVELNAGKLQELVVQASSCANSEFRNSFYENDEVIVEPPMAPYFLKGLKEEAYDTLRQGPKASRGEGFAVEKS